ncbi:MAG: prohibitin family protein [Kofleriaceae bacterium]|nr:prohibitin family protein [Kofleriaceae bacterium]
MLVRSFVVLSLLAMSLGCIAVIDQGEVGIRNRWGKFDTKPITPGVTFYNPFSTDIERITTRTVNVEVRVQLPSKEGLSIETEVSILYHVDAAAAPTVLGTIGPGYQNTVILSTFRSAAADVSARFFAKDMHSGERSRIEGEIQKRMVELVGPRGFVIEAVLLKSIALPAGLASSIELKLQAEQDSQRMVFELERERQQAAQRKVQAEGIRDAQLVVSQGLSEAVLRFEAIKALKELAQSSNAKLVITDGKTPLVMPPSM